MRERSLGPHHMEVAASLNNLAVLLKTVGANEEAEALYTRSIRIKEAVLGPNHPQVHVEHSSKSVGVDVVIGVLVRLLREASLSVCLAVVQVSLSLTNLAALLRKMNKNAGAEELYRKALAIREDALGLDNPQVRHAPSAAFHHHHCQDTRPCAFSAGCGKLLESCRSPEVPEQAVGGFALCQEGAGNKSALTPCTPPGACGGAPCPG